MKVIDRACMTCAVIAGAIVGAAIAAEPNPVAVAADQTDKNEVHWAFQPPMRPKVPKVRNTDRLRTPIDAFVLHRLEDKGLGFSPDSDRVTLVRRAYLDLWGLPPMPEEVDAFLSDGRPDAYERLLDRLLAAPHFGQRWGRHWLDAVGYADTVGFDIDANLIIQSEGKWRYRDYVIAAFNKDLPYDQFVREQLAGDELVDWRSASKFTPEIRERLIATGFLRNARDESHEPESNIPLIFYGVLHNTLDIVGNSLLGLTLQCARCHNHKFDPISQKEYYQLMAFLTPAYNPQNWKPVYPWKAGIKDRGLPDVSAVEQAEIKRHNDEIDRQIGEWNKRLAAIRRPYEIHLHQAKLMALPEPIRADTKTAVDTPAAKRNEVQKYLAGKFDAALRVSPEEVGAALTADDRKAVAGIGDQIAARNRSRRSYGKIQALYDVGPPPPTFLLRRGNHKTPGKEVQPGFLKILCAADRPTSVSSRVPPGSSGRRLALAEWLTQPNSPASGLLSRVMVNRLWQHLFGQGIVPTSENFGHSGEPPSHPELLEWLGSEFTRTGWRIKPLLKLMMTSTAYRQASYRPRLVEKAAILSVEPEKVDPANKLLWKMRLRRLEAEVIRDALLAISGQLDSTMGGPPVLLKARDDGMVVIDDKALTSPTAKNRRSIYLLFRRAYNLSLLSVFDQPLVAVNCTRRDTSAVPLQSLTMQNDAFVAFQAGKFADRVAGMARGSKGKAVGIAFRLALARRPNAAEAAICCELLDRQAQIFRAAKVPGPEADHKALVQMCHTLLNTSEFLYVE